MISNKALYALYIGNREVWRDTGTFAELRERHRSLIGSKAKFERMLALGESTEPIDPRIMTAHYVGVP